MCHSNLSNFQVIPVRDAAILTTAYVAGTILGRNSTAPNTVNIYDANQLIIYWDFTLGSLTTGELKVDFASDLYYSLPYDGQTGNFTAGLVVTGATSGATGIIVKDTDGGATGTLVIKSVTPGRNSVSFMDNEALTDSSTGVAVVNLSGGLNTNTAITADECWFQESSESVSSGTSTISSKFYQTDTANGIRRRIAIPIKDRYIRISVKGTGTTTSSSSAITAVVGNV